MTDENTSSNVLSSKSIYGRNLQVLAPRLKIFKNGIPSSPEDSEAYQFLASLKEFAHLPSKQLILLADSARFADLDSGKYIAIEGEEASAFGFVLVSGLIAMLKTSMSGKDLIVELLHANDTFGLLRVLASKKLPAPLSARALKKSRVLWIPIEGFKKLLETNPSLYGDFDTQLLQRLEFSYKLSRGLAHDKVEIRIAAILSRLAIEYGKLTPPEKGLTVNFTRQQLADLTGTTSETAIRVTRAMQQNGLIEIKRPGFIRILKLQALQEMAEE